MIQRAWFVGFLLCLVGLGVASELPPQGQDPDWDIIRRSTEYLSFQAQSTAQPYGSPAVRNLYQAYMRFRGSRSLTLANALEINSMLRQNGAEAGHVQDKGGGGLRTQNVGFFNNGEKVIDFPDWQTLPAKAKYLDSLLRRVSTQALSRDAAIDAAAEAHLIIGKQQLFSDGNHRTARVVSDWILMRQGLPPARHDALPKESYELEMRISQKGAMELFRQHMQQAVAAAEGTRASAKRGPPAVPARPAKPFGKADWAQDSPELERPTAPLAGPLIVQPSMRLAIGEGRAYLLDDQGRLESVVPGSAEAPVPVAAGKRGGLVAIDCLGAMLLALDARGRLLRIQGDSASEMLPGRPAYSFRVTGKGRLYAVLSTGLIVEYDGQKWRSLGGLDGARQATLDDRSLLFVLNAGGQAYRRVDGAWRQVDDGSGTRQIEASAGRLLVLKQDGNVWRSGEMLQEVRWERIDEGTGSLQIAGDGDDAFILKDDGRVFRFDAATPGWSPVPSANRVVALRVRAGTALALDDRGRVAILAQGDARAARRRAQFEQIDGGKR